MIYAKHDMQKHRLLRTQRATYSHISMPSGIITINAVPVSNPAPNSVINRILADGTVGLLLPLPPFPSLAPMHMGKYLACWLHRKKVDGAL